MFCLAHACPAIISMFINCRFWLPKFVLLVACCVGGFFIPEEGGFEMMFLKGNQPG